MVNVHIGVKDILVEKTVGVYVAAAQTAPWSIFLENEPEGKPDRAISVWVRGGENANPAWLLDYPRVQVRVRAEDGSPVVAHTKASDVLEALNGYPSHTRSGDRWVGIWNRGGVVSMGKDKNNRPFFVVNFQLIIEPATSAFTNRQPLPS